MSKLFFINLSIDQNWARGSLFNSLFSNGNPISLKLSLLPQNLVLYHKQFNPNDDWLVVSDKIDPFWLNHFDCLSSVQSARTLIVGRNPYDTEVWFRALKEQLKLVNFQTKLNEILFAANSELELKIFDLLKPTKELANLKFDFNSVNSKIWLFHWAQANRVSFPPSEVVTGIEILKLQKNSGSEDVIFKSDISSGGSGQLSWTRLRGLIPWIERQSLLDEWNHSRWLKQQKCNRIWDFSCFGSTDQLVPFISQIKYDENNLSYAHEFTHQCHSSELELVHSVYSQISTELLKMGYQGPFGFDGFKAQEGFFPIVDLNVRMTKTHLLYDSLAIWKLNPIHTKIFRFRFINKSKISFENFWTSFCEKQCLSDQGVSDEVQVSPLDVSGWMIGKSEITIAISSQSESEIEETYGRLKEDLAVFGE